MVSNDPENPAEFEWHSEKGLITNTRKVLEEFWKAHCNYNTYIYIFIYLFKYIRTETIENINGYTRERKG